MTPPSTPDAADDAVAAPPPDATTSIVLPVDAEPEAWDGPEDWQPLPKRAYRVFLYVALLVAAVPSAFATLTMFKALAGRDWRWAAIAAVWAATVGIALWVAQKRYRYTFWKLDEDGFAVRRGRLWQWETRVPTSRVQHLDLKRGPLERAHGLASLVLHTAGTRLSAVSISGLDDADAERLRDHFSRRIDRQDDDDHA
ncbi:MAG: PH domain-containing protein [Pseudomonadota bacterium]